jgi:transcriptional regulator with XRE-family HTH domain
MELRRQRAESGLTIEQVADRLELSPSMISRIETGMVEVRIKELLDLLDLYEVSNPT